MVTEIISTRKSTGVSTKKALRYQHGSKLQLVKVQAFKTSRQVTQRKQDQRSSK